jgi:hypothetical protein
MVTLKSYVEMKQSASQCSIAGKIGNEKVVVKGRNRDGRVCRLGEVVLV